MRIIDCNAPEGNAFAIMGLARKWGIQLGKDVKAIGEEMRSGDYENVCRVFEREFGSVARLVNAPWDEVEDDD